MKRLLLATSIVACMAAASGSFAQSAPPAPAASTADAGYAVRLDLANQLVEANGGRKQMEVLITAMVGAPMKAVAAALPEKDRPLFERIQARQQQMIIGLLPSIIDVSERAYASTFTEQELRDVLAFQLSPSGQAMIHKMPALNAEVMKDLMPLILQQVPKMMNTVLVEVCQEQHCTAQQQQTIAALMAKSMPGQPATAKVSPPT